MTSAAKAGVYVDAVNVTNNGGFGLRYDILRKFACRGGERPSRLNVYLAYDQDRAETDSSYKEKADRFCKVLRDFEYKVIETPVEHYGSQKSGESGTRSAVDIEMAIDMATQADHMDKIVLLTNKSSYRTVVKKVQEKGCRVEVVGFDDMSESLRKEADMHISGYLIPGLLPIESPYAWGEVGSRIRGVCYDYSYNDGYGFLRYLVDINEKLWITDSRFEESPYETAFAHVSQFEDNFDTSFLPSRDLIFEFDLVENEKGMVAENITLVSAP